MTKLTVKKISFSTYIKFAALFGASLGLLMTVLFLLMLPTVFLSEISQDAFPTMPFIIVYLLCPFMCAFAFTLWGLMSYPMFLLIQKIFKKFTLEVEFSPIEYPTQPTNITYGQYAQSENDNNTNQGVEE